VTGVTVELRFTDADAEQRFLSSSLPAAWERYETSQYWEQGWLWPYGRFETDDVGPDGGLVRFVFEGDPDAFAAAERPRWAAFDGLVDWSVERYDEAGFGSLLAQQRDASLAVFTSESTARETLDGVLADLEAYRDEL
jgi:hypothetical protein